MLDFVILNGLVPNSNIKDFTPYKGKQALIIYLLFYLLQLLPLSY